MDIQIRPLEVKDAYVSVTWRNNPEIWKLTGSCPDREVTIEMELEWIQNVLNRNDQKRYAIIADGNYIGNIYLTDIVDGQAEFHCFIGEIDYWGKGIATTAVKKLISQSDLAKIYSFIRQDNKASLRMHQKCGFKVVEPEAAHPEFVKVEYTNQ